MAILNGFIGYSLPDDLISGTGIRIGLLDRPVDPPRRQLSGDIPVRAATSPDRSSLSAFYLIHILIIPVAIGGLLAATRPHGPPEAHQFPGKAGPSTTSSAPPCSRHSWPRRRAFLLMVSGGLALLGGLAQINPIWQFGPLRGDKISYAVQPDSVPWAGLDGALRNHAELGVDRVGAHDSLGGTSYQR